MLCICINTSPPQSEKKKPAASASFLCGHGEKRRRADPEPVPRRHRRLRAADALQAIEECFTTGLAITDGQENINEGGPWR